MLLNYVGEITVSVDFMVVIAGVLCALFTWVPVFAGLFEVNWDEESEEMTADPILKHSFFRVQPKGRLPKSDVHIVLYEARVALMEAEMASDRAAVLLQKLNNKRRVAPSLESFVDSWPKMGLEFIGEIVTGEPPVRPWGQKLSAA